MSDTIALSAYRASPTAFSAELASVDVDTVLSRVALQSEASAVRVVSLDAARLIETLPVGQIPVDSRYELFDVRMRPIARRLSRDESRVYLTFASDDAADLAVLIAESDGGQVSGWRDRNGKRALIVPALQNSGEIVPNTQLLIELEPGLDPEAPELDDYGDVRSPDAADGEVAEDDGTSVEQPVLDVGEDLMAPVTVTPERPLVIYAAYTPRAEQEANAALTHPVHLVASQADSIRLMLRYAGIDVRIETPIVEGLQFTEPVNDQEGRLKELVTQLATDTGTPALVDFRRRRAEVQGDIGILVVHRDSPIDCGYTTGVGVPAEMALAVINWQCIRQAYSYMHELGHILGGYHQRVSDPSEAMPDYARAFVFSQGQAPFVTLMGYRQACGPLYCTRINYLSSPATSYRGTILGVDGAADNARAVRAGLVRAVDFGESLQAGGAVGPDGTQPATDESGDVAGGSVSVWDIDRRRLAGLESALVRARADYRAIEPGVTEESDANCLAYRYVDAARKLLQARLTVRQLDEDAVQPLLRRQDATRAYRDFVYEGSDVSRRTLRRMNEAYTDYLTGLRSRVDDDLGLINEEQKRVITMIDLPRAEFGLTPCESRRPRRAIGLQYQ